MTNISVPSSVVSAVATGGATARSRVPLELNAEVITADGTRYRWGPNEPAASRVKNFSFGTKIGEGFSQASGQLPRAFLQDYPDQSLIDTVTFSGADGSVAYEGRIHALPRELSDTSSIGVTMAGWMAHTTDMKFTEVYVDRDLSAWSGTSLGRQSVLLQAGYTPNDGQSVSDVTTATAGLVTAIDGAWSAGFRPASEMWYDAGPGIGIGAIAYSWLNQKTTTIDYTDTNWLWGVANASDDKGTTSNGTGNLRGPTPGSGTFTTPGRYRYAFLQLQYNNSPAGADGAHFGIAWYNLAIYGISGVPTFTGEPGQPAGVRGADVIRDIAKRFCPRLDTTGVLDSSYVIQHLTFKDPTTPFDAFQLVNKYHLWNLAVWEDRKLYWTPFDLSDYTWQVRTDDPGTTFSQQGPSVDTVSNGITVAYNDVLSGKKGYITPVTNPELLDTDPTNPWNAHGVSHWDDLQLSYPDTAGGAAQAGREALAERNRPKHPGQITIQGYIRDRAGNEQPGWKPRAGETVAITDHPYDAPRLIHETSWDDESKTLTLTVDGPPSVMDAQMDRVLNALTAKGLAS